MQDHLNVLKWDVPIFAIGLLLGTFIGDSWALLMALPFGVFTFLMIRAGTKGNMRAFNINAGVAFAFIGVLLSWLLGSAIQNRLADPAYPLWGDVLLCLFMYVWMVHNTLVLCARRLAKISAEKSNDTTPS